MKINGNSSNVSSGIVFLSILSSGFFTLSNCLARNNIREAFFDVYPESAGAVIETVPSHVEHCGLCHFDFGGGERRRDRGDRFVCFGR